MPQKLDLQPNFRILTLIKQILWIPGNLEPSSVLGIKIRLPAEPTTWSTVLVLVPLLQCAEDWHSMKDSWCAGWTDHWDWDQLVIALLKVVSLSSWAMSGGSLFHLVMVRGKYELPEAPTLQVMLLKGCALVLVWLVWGTKIFWVGTTSLWWIILWQVKRSVILRLQSAFKGGQFKVDIMSVMLSVRLRRPVTNLPALDWTFSSLRLPVIVWGDQIWEAYSSWGRTYIR